MLSLYRLLLTYAHIQIVSGFLRAQTCKTKNYNLRHDFSLTSKSNYVFFNAAHLSTSDNDKRHTCSISSTFRYYKKHNFIPRIKHYFELYQTPSSEDLVDCSLQKLSFSLHKFREKRFSFNLIYRSRCLFSKIKKKNNKKTVKDFEESYTEEIQYQYTYGYNEKILHAQKQGKNRTVDTKFVLLIHPIGVGISRWYYDRLLKSLDNASLPDGKRFVFLAPDLLGCGSACNPNKIEGQQQVIVKKLPLLYPRDWAEQLIDFMVQCESHYMEKFQSNSSSWCVIANGGCVSIALEIGKQVIDSMSTQSSVESGPLSSTIESSLKIKFPLTDIILSAAPNLSSLLKEANPTEAEKAYRKISGILGSAFWWYSLRSDGKFIQTFSEKNLVSRPENLGKLWRPNCVEIARIHDGKSRFSTFSFLAGSLRGGCEEKLNALKDKEVNINIIKGVDVRKNSAKSWFWKKNRESTNNTSSAKNNESTSEKTELLTLPELLHNNGNGGNVFDVGGRICLAHEDPTGFTKAVLNILTPKSI